MTPKRFVRLLFLGWVVLSLGPQPVIAGDKTSKQSTKPRRESLPARLFGKNRSEAPPPRDPLHKTVEGKNESKDIAEALAVEQAYQELKNYLQKQTPRIESVPDKEYILSHLLSHQNVIPPGTGSGEDEGKYQVTFELNVSDKEYDAMFSEELKQKNEAREALAWGRKVGLGKILGAIVALLAAITGYLRLEEATKGYYTTWLRLGAISFLGAVGIGMWLIS